jgi:hypothetical protein
LSWKNERLGHSIPHMMLLLPASGIAGGLSQELPAGNSFKRQARRVEALAWQAVHDENVRALEPMPANDADHLATARMKMDRRSGSHCSDTRHYIAVSTGTGKTHLAIGVAVILTRAR